MPNFLRSFLLIAIVVGLAFFYYFTFKPVTIEHDGFFKDYTKAQTAAVEQNKPILIYFTASWCGPCQRMKKETWSDEQFVKEQITPVAIPVFADDATPEGKALFSKYGINSIPTLFLVNADGDPLQGHTGYMSRDDIKTLFTGFKNDGILNHYAE